MNFCDINPFIRFAEQIFHSRPNGRSVFVRDCRIFYTISGKADMFIENQHYELVPNSLFYCTSGSVYKIQSNGARLISLNFDLTQKNNKHTEYYSRITIRKNQTLPNVVIEPINDCTFINSHIFLPNADEFLEPLKKILREFSTQKILYRENSSVILKSILVKLYRISLASTENSATAITKVMDYIKENYASPLNNELLSSMSGYHEYHLNRLFVKHTGTSIHKYILNIRINEAKKMLLTTEHSLATIAENVGFNSNTHFSSYFKQVIGISPLEFRKQFKNKL